MPFDLQYWANLAAIISAMTDAITLGQSFSEALKSRTRDPEVISRARVLEDSLSTYTDDEIKAIERRIKICRDRFISEGSGEQRKVCLCSVFRDVKDGNGGALPFEDWQRAYNQLGCN